tara:strand:+ start:147 stop:623 length:477 start_codon:yes stop_codon:yes gene_type:complete
LLDGILMEQHVNHKTSVETFSDLKSIKNSYLVDVRTVKELNTNGVADLSQAAGKVIFCEWRENYKVSLDKNFCEELLEKIDFKSAASLYFICAAGYRSNEAAKRAKFELKELGSDINFVNVSDGFEGTSRIIFNFRSSNGWKESGLPWCQYFETETAK